MSPAGCDRTLGAPLADSLMALCSSVQSPGEVTGWWVVLELVTQACLHGGVNCSLLSRAGVFSSDHCSSSSISYTKAEKHL